MSIDASTDYLSWDNTEAVTVHLRRSSGTTEVSVTHALQQEIDRRRSQYGTVALTGQETIWHVPHALLAPNAETRRIEVDDYIVDAASRTWVVLQSSWAAWRTRWECVCSELRST